MRTTDVGSARAFYAGLFGPDFWGPGISLGELPAQAAVRGAPPDLVRPRALTMHPQWLFFFPTTDLTASLTQVRDAGGLTLPTLLTADGYRVAVCDDPQGAAFGLQEVVRSVG